MSVFFNVSNHPSNKWSAKQIDAVESVFTRIIDVQFPNVPATASTKDVKKLAQKVIDEQILPVINWQEKAPCALVQGEMTLTLAIVRQLQANHINCVAACSERRSVETVNPDGSVIKTAVFEFVQFRSYPED